MPDCPGRTFPLDKSRARYYNRKRKAAENAPKGMNFSLHTFV